MLPEPRMIFGRREPSSPVHWMSMVKWECPNVWDFVFLAFHFEMPFHPKSILLEPLKNVYLQIKTFVGCYFDKS